MSAPEAREPFSVRVAHHGDAVVVAPAGELDIATAPLVESAIARALREAPRVVFDLRELTFIDSSGLRTLLTARGQAQHAGAEFSLVAGDPALDRTLEIAGVRQAFAWTPASELASD